MTLSEEDLHELQTGEKWNKKFQERFKREAEAIEAYRASIPNYEEKLKKSMQEIYKRLRQKGLNIDDDGNWL